MDSLDYILPSKLRAALFLALVLLANTPYIGTSVSGRNQCMQSYCDSAADPYCNPGKQCSLEYQSKPSWVFWWPYPEFTVSYGQVQFSADSAPLIAIQGKPELYSADGLAATLAYWYAVVLLITIPLGREGKNGEEEERRSG
ncbi:MAG: hypothetical protein V1787_03990 [Candidatus Micrarchaeota archaeon]